MRSSFFTTILLAASQAAALVRSPKPTQTTGGWSVGGYIYARRSIFNFATGTALPEGLYRSTWPIDDTHIYQAENAVVSGGYLNLKVPGGQTAKPYKCAEVSTTFSNIKYASVRTVAIFSNPAGVCNGQITYLTADNGLGIFFYWNGTQEIDIEWLSDPASLSNQGTRWLWLTNQDADLNGQKTINNILPPSNPTVEEHEYRIDWTPGLVKWFVDGTQVWQTTSDVPTVPGSWIFNNWANGDIGWSAGPPTQEANFKIKDVEMYYNTA
ncbi:hypothetical protein CPLU01_06881 [Colletotrichum plurivorum]|uniref:GH16 domain-containing protein n=1 Tax=Colletotrichum plurivorum TaxID=2175906 RepID=A0A8H6NFQ8_9PEZI|nr:hypothetical protein CPLU01_06881 [Colletotrichum plurivorum]